MRRLGLLATACCLLLALASPAAAQDFVPGELIVRFAPKADAGDRAGALAPRRAAVRRDLRVRGLSLVRLQQGDSVRAAAAALERDPDVLYAEPNYIFRLQRTPNDTFYGDLWGMPVIQAPAAWDTRTSAAGVVVAVVDSGVDYTHPDLAPNIWSNPGEVADGDDDDGNGKIDDVRGWDAADGDANPMDADEHGTHVAGTIGAKGDNTTGVTGVAWDVSIMPVKVARSSNGELTSDAIVSGFQYACAEGADVVNGSFGGEGHYQPFEDAVNACPGTLFVFAAGNGGLDQVGDDNDAVPFSPCTVNAPNVLCVAATDETDLTWFSNYGWTTVDLGAPGLDVYSTVPGGYDSFHGTSMAAPHVAGAAALVLAQRPSLTAVELRNAIINSLTPMPGLAGWLGTGGMLNVNGAFTAPTTPPSAVPPPPPPPPPPPAPPPPPGPPPPPADATAPTDPAVASTSHVAGARSVDATVDVTWSGAFDYGSGIDGFSFHWDAAPTTTPDTAKEAEESTDRTTSATLAPGTYWFHLRTRDNAGNWTPGTHAGPFVIGAAAVAQPQRCVVPRVRGKTTRTAATLLKRAGCKLGPVKRVRSRVRKGRIVSQRPPAGRHVGKGTPVVVTVSRGRR